MMKKILFLIFILFTSKSMAVNDSNKISANIIGKNCLKPVSSEFLFEFENSEKYSLLINQNITILKNKLLSKKTFDEVSVSYETIDEKLNNIDLKLVKISEDFHNQISDNLNQEKLKDFLFNNSQLENIFFVDKENSIYSNFSDNFLSGSSFELCKMYDLTNINKNFILKFPEDFLFVIQETKKIKYPVETGDIFYGSLIEGFGTIFGIENCKEKGFINNNCSQIALTFEEGAIIIITEKLSLKEKRQFKIGANVNFNNCILTEIQNPRGMAGYEFHQYFKDMGKDVRKSVLEGIEAGRNSRDFDLGITDSIYSFSSKFIDALSLPKYVDSISCETSIKNLKIY